MAEGRAGDGEEAFQPGVAFGGGLRRRIGLGVVVGGQVVDLFDVEDGVAFQVGDFSFDLFAGRFVRFGLLEAVGVHHEAAVLALADMAAQFLRLLESHPNRGAVALFLGFHPQHEDIDAGIGHAVMPQGPGDLPGGVVGVPRLEPRPHAALKVGDDFLGDSAVNVRVHGAASFALG